MISSLNYCQTLLANLPASFPFLLFFTLSCFPKTKHHWTLSFPGVPCHFQTAAQISNVPWMACGSLQSPLTPYSVSLFLERDVPLPATGFLRQAHHSKSGKAPCYKLYSSITAPFKVGSLHFNLWFSNSCSSLVWLGFALIWNFDAHNVLLSNYVSNENIGYIF